MTATVSAEELARVARNQGWYVKTHIQYCKKHRRLAREIGTGTLGRKTL